MPPCCCFFFVCFCFCIWTPGTEIPEANISSPFFLGAAHAWTKLCVWVSSSLHDSWCFLQKHFCRLLGPWSRPILLCPLHLLLHLKQTFKWFTSGLGSLSLANPGPNGTAWCSCRRWVRSAGNHRVYWDFHLPHFGHFSEARKWDLCSSHGTTT